MLTLEMQRRKQQFSSSKISIIQVLLWSPVFALLYRNIFLADINVIRYTGGTGRLPVDMCTAVF